MDIEVKRMSPTAIEMLDQLSAVCKRFGVDYYAASQNQRDLLDSIALHEYQLKKAHEQGDLFAIFETSLSDYEREALEFPLGIFFSF